MALLGIELDDISSQWPNYYFNTMYTVDPFGALQKIVDRNRNGETLSNFAFNPELEELEKFISVLMRGCHPTHFLIDGFDDIEGETPAIWQNMQQGLFWLAFRSETTRRPLKSVRLTIAVRDTILNIARRSEHEDKFQYGTSMMVLSWSKEAGVAFFRSLLWKIRNKNFWKRTKKLTEHMPEVSWLGHEAISYRGNQEDAIIDYIVRHSRCSPRDLISMGNSIARQLNDSSEQARRDSETIKKAVGRASKEIARLSLKSAAFDIMKNSEFGEIVSQIVSGLPADDATDSLTEFLIKLIGNIRSEVTLRSNFRDAVIDCLKPFTDEERAAASAEILINAFWTNGIIAIRPKKPVNSDWRFAWSDPNRFYQDLPKEDGFVGFHPSMFELVKLRRSARGPAY